MAHDPGGGRVGGCASESASCVSHACSIEQTATNSDLASNRLEATTRGQALGHIVASLSGLMFAFLAVAPHWRPRHLHDLIALLVTRSVELRLN